MINLRLVTTTIPIILGAALLAISALAQAAAVDKLRGFLGGTHTLRASFEQVVLDKDGRPLQLASGTMQFSRPGKFRWEYLKPYKQLVVGDGKKLWIFDPDLNQVTVRELDQAIGSSPAALLAGDATIEANFNLKDGGGADRLDWLDAIPKSKETSFEKVRMGFSGAALKVMELKDYFGQTTVIKFDQLEKNLKLPAEGFVFVPPPGADVIKQ